MTRTPDKRIGRFVVPGWLPSWMHTQIEMGSDLERLAEENARLRVAGRNVLANLDAVVEMTDFDLDEEDVSVIDDARAVLGHKSTGGTGE